jgi:hypothetical protein
MAGLLAALLLGGVGVAHAQGLVQIAGPAKPKVTLSTDSYVTAEPASPNPSQYTGAATRKTMVWEGAGRWGVKLRMDQTVARPLTANDVEAGAFYKVTPSLRVGGAVGLTGKPQEAAPKDGDQTRPRVKLETTLKF